MKRKITCYKLIIIAFLVPILLNIFSCVKLLAPYIDKFLKWFKEWDGYIEALKAYREEENLREINNSDMSIPIQ